MRNESVWICLTCAWNELGQLIVCFWFELYFSEFYMSIIYAYKNLVCKVNAFHNAVNQSIRISNSFARIAMWHGCFSEWNLVQWRIANWLKRILRTWIQLAFQKVLPKLPCDSFFRMQSHSMIDLKVTESHIKNMHATVFWYCVATIAMWRIFRMYRRALVDCSVDASMLQKSCNRSFQ